MSKNTDIEHLCINTVRGLSMDAPHRARSGHQGTAMALAPLGHILWTRIMKYDAGQPEWRDRDRFILSAGHASILLYAFLYLTGYGLTLEDLKDFRQLNSLTPGHPEAGHTAGVEVTTGPLGQGFANGVGMAIAEKSLRERYGSEVCDHNIYAICSDGDLAEGVSHEAASIAGHLGLGKLVYVYDDNKISIDGTTSLWLSDNAEQRFKSYGWEVINLGEKAEDLPAIEAALNEARSNESAPSLVILQSHIAFPSPDLLDDPKAHGYALFDEEISAAKNAMGIKDESFFVSDEVLDFYRNCGESGKAKRLEWEKRVKAYSGDSKSLEDAWMLQGAKGWEKNLPEYSVGDQVATRVASGKCLNALVGDFPSTLAGGADLTGNTGTSIDSPALEKTPSTESKKDSSKSGRQIYFGVREHAMGSLMVGMARHGGILPVGGTFLVFSDYMRPAIRLAALSKSKAVFVFTHDSVGVGEDGPTHQPIEQIAALRSIPQLTLIRPADATETAGAWQAIMQDPAKSPIQGPVALILTRQNVEVLKKSSRSKTARGAYVIYNSPSEPVLQILASGSEVQLGIQAAEMLEKEGVYAQVVSFPSFELFELQPQDYRQEILLDVPRISIEAGCTFGWNRWADKTIGINQFGASAPGEVVMEELGMKASTIYEAAMDLLK